MDSLTLNFFVRDMAQTLNFYRLLGFEVLQTVPPESSDEAAVWAMMACGKVLVMFQTFDSLGEELTQISRQDGGSLLLYIKISDIRMFFEQISTKVQVLKGLETTFYGATEFSILDNNNYVLTFAEDEGVTQAS